MLFLHGNSEQFDLSLLMLRLEYSTRFHFRAALLLFFRNLPAGAKEVTFEKWPSFLWAKVKEATRISAPE